jgi:hypothetical protein
MTNCTRYGILMQTKTNRKNRKSKSIEEKFPKIKRFHWWTQYQMVLEEPSKTTISLLGAQQVFVNTTNENFYRNKNSKKS